jgi:hypothetical protein
VYAYSSNPLKEVDILGLTGTCAKNPPAADGQPADTTPVVAHPPGDDDGTPTPRPSTHATAEQAHCTQRADEMRAPRVRRTAAGATTICVAVVDGPTGRRTVVTASTPDGLLPPRVRGDLRPGETNPPTDPVVRRRTAGRVEVDSSSNESRGTYKPGNSGNDFAGETRHHGEQRMIGGGAVGQTRR